LDRLATRGTRFANAFTPCPVCSPARACLITGRTPSQVGIHDWLEEQHEPIGQRDWLAHERTLPELLSDAGYHAVRVGKWHLGQSHRRPPGFDRFFAGAIHTGPHFGDIAYIGDDGEQTIAGAKTTVYTDAAERFIADAPRDKPLFLYVGYSATHSPYQAEAHDPAATAPYATARFNDIPPYRPHPWHKNEGLAGGDPPSEADMRTRYRGYYAAVSEIDAGVGRVLTALDRRGGGGGALVVYTADHGCALGHQGYWGKGNSTRPLNMHEASIRVPLIVAGPGVAADRIEPHGVDHYDTFAALAEAGHAELDAARHYPGRSWRPLAAGDTDPDWDDARYGEYGDLRMIRTPTRKFVKRYPHGPYDLFDLERDPDETLNRAGWEQYLSEQRDLDARLEAWYARHEDAARTGLRVKALPMHNRANEAWRDGRREQRGLQVY
ncbi:MAG: sulfatase-like hydrolase/transferase, partial [Phycisphaeraceae bacterium]